MPPKQVAESIPSVFFSFLLRGLLCGCRRVSNPQGYGCGKIVVMADDKPLDSPFVEFLSPLQQMANAMHETYSAFLFAGFDEDQSMQILLHMAEMNNLRLDKDEDDG